MINYANDRKNELRSLYYKTTQYPCFLYPPKEEKNWLDVYFPALGLEPLQWLYEVVEQIKEAVKTK